MDHFVISKGPTDRYPLLGRTIGFALFWVTARWALYRLGIGSVPRALPWAFGFCPFGAAISTCSDSKHDSPTLGERLALGPSLFDSRVSIPEKSRELPGEQTYGFFEGLLKGAAEPWASLRAVFTSFISKSAPPSDV